MVVCSTPSSRSCDVASGVDAGVCATAVGKSRTPATESRVCPGCSRSALATSRRHQVRNGRGTAGRRGGTGCAVSVSSSREPRRTRRGRDVPGVFEAMLQHGPEASGDDVFQQADDLRGDAALPCGGEIRERRAGARPVPPGRCPGMPARASSRSWRCRSGAGRTRRPAGGRKASRICRRPEDRRRDVHHRLHDREDILPVATAERRLGTSSTATTR